MMENWLWGLLVCETFPDCSSTCDASFHKVVKQCDRHMACLVHLGTACPASPLATQHSCQSIAVHLADTESAKMATPCHGLRTVFEKLASDSPSNHTKPRAPRQAVPGPVPATQGTRPTAKTPVGSAHDSFPVAGGTAPPGLQHRLKVLALVDLIILAVFLPVASRRTHSWLPSRAEKETNDSPQKATCPALG
jgi:hypothetical protein